MYAHTHTHTIDLHAHPHTQIRSITNKSIYEAFLFKVTSSITCAPDGQWDGDFTTCKFEPGECEAPSTNGTLRFICNGTQIGKSYNLLWLAGYIVSAVLAIFICFRLIPTKLLSLNFI